MDEKTALKLIPFNQKLKNVLPYLIAFVSSIVFIFIWTIWVKRTAFSIATFKDALPWIYLVSIIALFFLVAIGIHLFRERHERSLAYAKKTQEFNNEMVERMRAEDTKQKLEIALLQSQKLQAIGTLAGGIAHDFNNILYAIIGYVEMAREDVAPESLVYKNLGKVLEAAARGQDLVARILAFGRRRLHREFKPIYLKTIIDNVLALLRPTVPASVMINVLGLVDDYQILGDQTQLHQVFVNIINNAVDAMDSEGTVTIEVNLLPAEGPYLKQFPVLAEGRYYKIDICDTGHGMDQLILERIFEPFFTTKEVGKGTGLGLSTVHAIMKEHQGAVTVTSQLGQGTTFTLLLPEHQPSEEDEYGNDYVSGR